MKHSLTILATYSVETELQKLWEKYKLDKLVQNVKKNVNRLTIVVHRNRMSNDYDT